MMPKISVVCINYNKGIFLEDALSSITNQTFDNFEAIIVDDGSTDNSREIIERFAKSDSRIVPLFKKNEGASAARNSGIDAARGEYVMFLDSDDCFLPWAFEYMFDMMSSSGADHGHAHFVCVPEEFDYKTQIHEIKNKLDYKIIDSYDIGTEIFSEYNMHMCWAGIFKKSFLNSKLCETEDRQRFCVGMHPHEDNLFATLLVACGGKVALSKAIIVYYRQNNTSVNSTRFSKHWLDSSVKCAYEFGKLLKNKNISEKFKYLIKFSIMQTIFDYSVSRSVDRKELCEYARKLCKEFCKSECVDFSILKPRHAFALRCFNRGWFWIFRLLISKKRRK